MPGSVKTCVTVGEDENGVTGVPSSKSHWNCTPTPPVTLAEYVTLLPVTTGLGGGGVSRTYGRPSLITQVKLLLSLLTPSLAVTTTLNVPAALGVPLMTPVDG